MGGLYNHLGNRVGEWHGRAKYPKETVIMAKKLKQEGLGAVRIGQLLEVPSRTVSDWLVNTTRWVDRVGDK